MKLTGKAKDDFLEWYVNVFKKAKTYNLARFYKLQFASNDNAYKNAIIVEWFDSVGIYVNSIRYNGNDWFAICGKQFPKKYTSRREATNKAIEKANQIYNENTKNN